MPCHDCPLEKALVKTKSSKSHKKEKALVKTKSSKSHKKEKCCPSVCETECCLPDCHPDCCTPAFLRLDKLRTLTALEAITNQVYGGNNRAGVPISQPNLGLYTGANGVDLTAVDNAELAYYFVNAERYQSFEACGKEDQVVGWYVDTSDGNLELYQALPELNLTLTTYRATLDAIPTATLTTIQKQQLYQLNNLYKLSVQAIERVGANPKTEGNICEYTDKCGQKWLLLINRAQSGTSVAANNTQWTLTGVRLC